MERTDQTQKVILQSAFIVYNGLENASGTVQQKGFTYPASR